MKGLYGYALVGCSIISLTVAGPVAGGTLKCPPDSARVGNSCLDLYEASVWQVPLTNTKLVRKVQQGKATLADLNAGGAVQVSLALSCTPAFPASFPVDGNWSPTFGSSPPSPGIYALSVAGVTPSACVSWFQAAQACALSGKRLLTNQEWQLAAAGTPDPGVDDGATTCVTGTFAGPAATGSRSQCRSNWGVFDMVGNVWEWVADWVDLMPNCTDWKSTEGISNGDRSCFGAPGGPGGAHDLQSIPGALFRGGNWVDGLGAGVFAVEPRALSVQLPDVGFRCAR